MITQMVDIIGRQRFEPRTELGVDQRGLP